MPWKDAQTYSEYITSEDFDRIRTLIQEEWLNIVKRETRTDLSHYEYHFYNCYTASHFWELAIRRAILKNQPNTIWISESISTSGKLMLPDDHITCLGTFNEWMLNRSILKVLNEVRPHVRTYSDEKHKATDKRKDLSRHLSVPSLLAIERAVSVKLPSMLKDLLNSDRKFQKVLIIAQSTKTLRLEQALFKSGVNFQVSSYDSTKKAIRELGANTDFIHELEFNHETNCLDALIDWITHISLYHDKVFDQKIAEFLRVHCSTILITDGDHDPVVRRIDKYTRNHPGYTLFTVPEGGYDMDRYPSCETFRLKPHHNLIKCVLSRENADRIENNNTEARETLVIGYDTSLVLARLIGRIIRFLIKIIAGRKYKAIVFYDYSCISKSDLGIIRVNRIPYKDEILSTKQISAALAESNYLILSHRRSIKEYSRYFPRTFIHLGFHWSLLASIADVVISNSSSIVSESLAIKRPVLLWQRKTHLSTDWPYSYLTSTPACRKIIRRLFDIDKLDSEIQELAKASDKDFKQLEYYIPKSRHAMIASKVRLLLNEAESRQPG